MNYFHNTKLRILNITHCDMDGAASGIVIKNYFNDVITESITYSQENTIIPRMSKHRDNFDAVIFTDFTPCNLNEVKAFGKPVLVLDHHESAIKFNNPKEFVYVCPGFSGAKLAYEYFNHNDCLKHLEELVTIVNDFDLYLLKDPRSKPFNSLYWDMGFSWFINRFYSGDVELSKPEKAFLVRKQKEFKKYYDNLEISDLKNGGVFCYSDKFISEVSDALKEEGYKWIILYRTGFLSVRSADNSDINLVEVTKILGKGGGHEHAVGIPQEKDQLNDLIKRVEDSVESYLESKKNPPADAFMNKLMANK